MRWTCGCSARSGTAMDLGLDYFGPCFWFLVQPRSGHFFWKAVSLITLRLCNAEKIRFGPEAATGPVKKSRQIGRRRLRGIHATGQVPTLLYRSVSEALRALGDFKLG